MHTRQNALNTWLKTIFRNRPFTITPLAGDASFRRYFRLQSGEIVRIVMDAPPDKEGLTAFISIAAILTQVGVHTPTIHAVEPTLGFVLLEDLGDQLLLNALSHDNADMLYKAAMTTLAKIQQAPTTAPECPTFDNAFILSELALFRAWFLGAYLAIPLNTDEEHLIDQTFQWLAAELLAQPQVFIHRDYHSRNLMLVDDNAPNNISVIDFQDAMRGPFTYDLVSLLKDCYIQWPQEQIQLWVTHFHQYMPTPIQCSLPEFKRAFDLCGLQRHLKVLGVFCRLHLRDNKPAYLQDLPLTFNYVMACLESYPELQPFHHFMLKKVQLAFLEKSKA